MNNHRLQAGGFVVVNWKLTVAHGLSPLLADWTTISHIKTPRTDGLRARLSNSPRPPACGTARFGPCPPRVTPVSVSPPPEQRGARECRAGRRRILPASLATHRPNYPNIERFADGDFNSLDWTCTEPQSNRRNRHDQIGARWAVNLVRPAHRKARPNRRKLFPACNRQQSRIQVATPSPAFARRWPIRALIMQSSCFLKFSRNYRGRMWRAQLWLGRRPALARDNSSSPSERA